MFPIQPNYKQNPIGCSVPIYDPKNDDLYVAMGGFYIFDPPAGQTRIFSFQRNGSGNKITCGEGNYHDIKPKPSPRDGKIAFLSDRGGLMELFCYRPGSLEPFRALSLPGPVSDFAWRSDGRAIIALTGKHDFEGGDLDDIKDDFGLGGQLFAVDLDDEPGEEEPPISPVNIFAHEFCLVDEGAVVIASHDGSDNGREDSKVIALDFVTGGSRDLYASSELLCGLEADHRMKRIAFLEGKSEENGTFRGSLLVADLTTEAVWHVPTDDELAFSSIVGWRNDAIVFTGWRAGVKVFGAVSTSGDTAWVKEVKDLIEQPFGEKEIAMCPMGLSFAALLSNPEKWDICVCSAPFDWRPLWG